MDWLLSGSAWLGALFVFFMRVLDMSCDTLRVLFVVRGKKKLSWILGFAQSAIFVVAISQVLTHLDNPLTVIGYAAGFATGNVVGMYIEERSGDWPYFHSGGQFPSRHPGGGEAAGSRFWRHRDSCPRQGWNGDRAKSIRPAQGRGPGGYDRARDRPGCVHHHRRYASSAPWFLAFVITDPSLEESNYMG